MNAPEISAQEMREKARVARQLGDAFMKSELPEVRELAGEVYAQAGLYDRAAVLLEPLPVVNTQAVA